MLIIGSILLIVVLVVVVRFLINAAKASTAIYEQYQGVFGKGSTLCLLFGVTSMIPGAGSLVIGFLGLFFDFSSESFMIILTGVIFTLLSLCVFWLVINGAKSRCPKELEEGLYRAILIATLGMFGTYCRYCWNASCGILSIIPGMGWIANFIITKDKATKKDL